jgi:tRNA threonylcarbamoyladenosine biosynthesis protein TsaE
MNHDQDHDPDHDQDDAFSSTLRLHLQSAAEMQALATRLGQEVAIGDVVALTGPLGAGKTTLVQGLARGLEVPADRHVASPTFALVNEHPGRIPLVHVDFYRINSSAELPELGLEEAYDQAATAIEWAERFPEWLPVDVLGVTIQVEGRSRMLEIRSRGPRSHRLLSALASWNRLSSAGP